MVFLQISRIEQNMWNQNDNIKRNPDADFGVWCLTTNKDDKVLTHFSVHI